MRTSGQRLMKRIVLRLIFFHRRGLSILLLLNIIALLVGIRCSAAAPAGSALWERVDNGLPAVAPVLSLAPRRPREC